jgi:hypothetical protein
MTSPPDNMEYRETKEPSLFDRFFRDSQGNIVIAQPPNLPLTVGLTATAIQFLLPPGNLKLAFTLVAFGTLYTWAWLELFSGVNYFRRSLGLMMLCTLMALGLNQGGF